MMLTKILKINCLLYARKVLKEVVKVNKMFQAENADITKLTQEMLNMYRNLMQLDVCQIENLPNLLFMDYLIPICAIQFGYDFCTAASNCTLNEDQMNYLKERCVKFVVELLKEVQMGLPDYIDTLPMMKQLHPKIATAQCKGKIGQVA